MNGYRPGAQDGSGHLCVDERCTGARITKLRGVGRARVSGLRRRAQPTLLQRQASPGRTATGEKGRPGLLSSYRRRAGPRDVCDRHGGCSIIVQPGGRASEPPRGLPCCYPQPRRPFGPIAGKSSGNSPRNDKWACSVRQLTTGPLGRSKVAPALSCSIGCDNRRFSPREAPRLTMSIKMNAPGKKEMMLLLSICFSPGRLPTTPRKESNEPSL